MSSEPTSDDISEWDTGSYFARYTYQVANPMLALGQQKILQFDDLMKVSQRDKVTVLERDLKIAYAQSKKIFGIPRIFVALLRAHFFIMIIASIFTMMEGAIRVLNPVVLSWLLTALSDPETPDSEAFTYAAILGFLALLQTYVHHTLFLYTMRMGINWRAATTALIYDRLFHLNGSVTSGSGSGSGERKAAKVNTGNLVNLISGDVQRIEQFAVNVCFIWESWLELGGILYVLIDKVSLLPAIAGVGVTLLFIPVQISIAKLFARIRSQTARETDRRVRHISEAIDGISSVKSYCWELPFFELIGSFRSNEVGSIRNSNTIKAANYGLEYALPPVALFVIFIVYRSQGNTLTIPVVFSTLALVQVLKAVMGRQWTLALERGSETMSSCARIDAFLAMTNESALSTTGPDNGSSAASSAAVVETDAHIELVSAGADGTAGLTEQGSLLFDLATPTSFAYDIGVHSIAPADSTNESDARPGSRSPQPPTLRGLQFSVGRGELVLVVGGVGAGKSSLLLSMMQEIPTVSPTTAQLTKPSGSAISSRRAYCAQRPWIIAATVRENITIAGGWTPQSVPDGLSQGATRRRVDSVCGGDLDEALYGAALESCCIVEDLDGWAAYDATEIGERGISVSGGQKARIALARAVYSDADLYLLDDPLSAVDAHVGKALFFNCIVEQLVGRGKGVVLATHQLQYLPHAHKVIVLSDSGEQQFCGSYEEFSLRVDEFPQLGLSAGSGTGEPNSSALAETPAASAETGYVPRKYNPTSSQDKSATDYEKRRIIVQLEDRMEGAIGTEVIWRYLEAGGLAQGLSALALAVVAQVLIMMTNYWLKWWAGEQLGEPQGAAMYIWGNAILVGSCIVMGFARSSMWFRFTLHASSTLHDRALWAVIRSPMAFFVANPTGRILNRFSGDQNLVDELLAATSFDLIQTSLFCLSALVLACVSIPYIILMLPFLLLAFYFLRSKYIASSREVKRMMAVLRSPLFATFSASLDGLITLRAYQLRGKVTAQFHQIVDRVGRAQWSFLMISRWLGFRLDLLSASVVVVTSLLAVVLRNEIDIGLLGFALVYTISLSGLFQWTVRQSAEVESQLTSVERLNTYSMLPPEPGYCSGGEYAPRGQKEAEMIASKVAEVNGRHNQSVLRIEDLVVTYREDLDPVLRGLSLHIPAGFKVGICGRTGCGKSSLLLALLRLNIITSGDIKIVSNGDAAETNAAVSLLHDLDLETARGLVAVIPQEPHLFSGTLRYNLDPFSAHSDADIWAALEDAHIKEHFVGLAGGGSECEAEAQVAGGESGSLVKEALETVVEENGKNFSAGQRQLLSLARAILRRCSIILMDEVSASVDFVTDKLIQTTIRTSPVLRDATIVTIAHRLRTIADCDMIVVINQGVVAEKGTPYELLTATATANSSDGNQVLPAVSLFRQLAEQSSEYEDIHEIALQSHTSKGKPEDCSCIKLDNVE